VATHFAHGPNCARGPGRCAGCHGCAPLTASASHCSAYPVRCLLPALQPADGRAADAELGSKAAEETYGRASGTSEAPPAQADLQTGPANSKLYRVDASHEGCSGLFYRSRPGVVSNDQGWPRNGAIVRGTEEKPGWLKLENGFWYVLVAATPRRVSAPRRGHSCEVRGRTASACRLPFGDEPHYLTPVLPKEPASRTIRI
jgi:hypothetical protein